MKHLEASIGYWVIKHRWWWLIAATLLVSVASASGMRYLTFENDLFAGLRLGVNDSAGTEFLAGLSYDLDNKGNVFRIEASRRLTENIKIFVDGWAFFDIEPGDYYLYSIRDDDFIRLQLFYYF